jgi:NADH dehydrogenase FAD-containing subunit
MSKTESTHNILILGGSFAGISEAHQLLRHVLPPLSAASNIAYKVTLVSPSAYLYWKIGAPRALVAPNLIPIEKQFYRIEDGFKEYPASRFQFIQASAISLDPNTKTVIAKPISEERPLDEKTIKVAYDSIVICTGVTQASTVYFQDGTDAATRQALKDMHKRLPEAQTIVVAGGGPAGTETAGELGSAYGKSKDITILSGSDRLLPGLRPAIGHEAADRLKGLGVKTINNVKVVSAEESNGKTTLKFSNGTSRTVDVYIAAVGEKPNSQFAPADWKNERGYIKTDPITLRVSVPDVSHAYALGSVASYSLGGITDIMNAVRPVAETIRVDLFSLLPASVQAALEPHKPSFPMSIFKSTPRPASEHHMPYKQWTSETQVVPIGTKQGVGALFGYKLPSWFVWMVKGKTYMIDKVPSWVTGADYKK